MSARRRGKQRDMQDTEREDGAGGRCVERGEGVMLELLANSDTSEGEEMFPENTARSSPPQAIRQQENDPTPWQDRAPDSVLLAPQLGKPSPVRRKRPPILSSTTRSRSSYTGPVEMIDRSGEGWAESMVDEEDDAVPATGYDVASSPDTPLRLALLSGTSSSFIRALPSPSSGAFTQDARILGWKIVGGKSKMPRDRDRHGRRLGDEMSFRTGENDSGVDDPQKPGVGAYGGMSRFIVFVRRPR